MEASSLGVFSTYQYAFTTRKTVHDAVCVILRIHDTTGCTTGCVVLTPLALRCCERDFVGAADRV